MEKDKLAALIPKADIRLCLHPIYPRFSEQPISQAEARNRLGLPEGASLLLFFGIVRPYKGLRYLLEAVAKVNRI
jgi:glycosyltransferase involved in cell wall biosynthesis